MSNEIKQCECCGHAHDFPNEWCICGMSEEQAQQLEEASNLWFKEIREEREKNARLTDMLAHPNAVTLQREVYDSIADFFTGDDDVDEDVLKQFLECGKC